MNAVLVQLFHLVLTIAIPLVSFATGLAAHRPFGRLFRERPGLLLRSLLAIVVLVPLWAVPFVTAFELPIGVRDGLLMAVLAIGIGPAVATRRMSPAAPSARYALELNVVVLLTSIVFVPLAFRFFVTPPHQDLQLSARQVDSVVMGRALVPLALGIVTARVFEGIATAASRYLGPVVNASLGVVILLALLATWRNLLSIGARGWLGAIGLAVGAIVIGHLLGGPQAEDRAVLAAASVMRFPALALMLAQLAPQMKLLVPTIMGYVLSSLMLIGVYRAVMRRRAGGPLESRRSEGTAPLPSPSGA